MGEHFDYTADYLPDYIPFHFPLETEMVRLHAELNLRYHQLIAWCMLECFWYHVIGERKASAEEYTRIYHEIEQLENDYESDLTVGRLDAAHPNGYSPTKATWNWHESRYPAYLVQWFDGVPRNPRFPWVVGDPPFDVQIKAKPKPEPKPKPAIKKFVPSTASGIDRA